MIRRSSRDRSTASCRSRSASRPGSRPSSCASAADIRARSATEATRGRNPRRCAPRVAPRRRSSNPRRVPAGSATTFSSPIEVRSRSTGSSAKRLLVDDRRRRSARVASSSSSALRQPLHVLRPQRGADVHPARHLVGAADHPAPARRSTRSSRSCDATPPAARADRTRSPRPHRFQASATLPAPVRLLEPRRRSSSI